MGISSEQARINGKRGGRPKGAKGKNAQLVQKFVDHVFKNLKDANGKKISVEEYTQKLLENCKSEKVQGMVLLRLLEYRYGRPIQQIEGDFTHTSQSVVETLQSARQRWREYDKQKTGTELQAVASVSENPDSEGDAERLLQ